MISREAREDRKEFFANFCVLCESRLDFRCGRGQIAGGADGVESLAAMGAVAERLVFGVAAAAQGDGRASRQPEGVSFHIRDGEFSFNANRAVVANGDFSWH